MASHWIHQQAAAGSSKNYAAGSYANEKSSEVDLTLKLGLPDDTDNTNTNANMFNPMASIPDNYNYHNNSFNANPYQGVHGYGPAGGHGGHEYQYGMACQQANPGFGNNYPMNNDGRIGYGGLNQIYEMGNYQYSQNMINPMNTGAENRFNMMNNGAGSMMAANFNPRGYNTGALPFPPPPIPNEYTLIDTPARRNRNVETPDPFLDGSSTVAFDWRGVQRQRTGTYNEPNKRCSNFNCGTTETPMWRRGPLGPKTLCNACGIKYRKEEEKRKAKEAARSSG